jgi:epoxyqueuosine reductase
MEEAWDCRVKSCVDTSPVLEKSYAARAGLGWIGRNTLLVNRNLGSFLFLGEILTDAEITPGVPVESLCSDCSLCLDACPTEALGRKTGLDATRCVSYLTLEHRSDIPMEFKNRLAGYAAGCDLCQTCCPHNSGAPAGRERAFDPKPGMAELTLEVLRGFGFPDFEKLAVDSSLERVKMPMWKRNIDANTPPD